MAPEEETNTQVVTDDDAVDGWKPGAPGETDDSTKETEKPDTEAAVTEAKAGWDKDRQQEQEASARERKGLEGQIAERDRQVDDLRKGADDLKVQLTKLQKTIESEQDSRDEEIDPEASPEEKRAIQQHRALTKTLNGIAGRLDDLETKTIPGMIETLREERNAERDSAWLERTCTTLDAKYGAEHRNDAIAAAREQVKADGFDGDNPPTSAYNKRVLEEKYAELAAKASDDSKTNKKTVATAAGNKGGSAAPARKVKHGTLKEVLADMDAHNEIPQTVDM